MQFSLAGGETKIALRKKEGRWFLVFGREPTTHILKPDRDRGGKFVDLVLNEYLCMAAADAMGLDVAHAVIVDIAGVKTLVSERYDRYRNGDTVTRIHQEDICQSLGIHPIDKYQLNGGPSIADTASIIHRSSDYPDEGKSKYLDALLFNWIGNHSPVPQIEGKPALFVRNLFALQPGLY